MCRALRSRALTWHARGRPVPRRERDLLRRARGSARVALVLKSGSGAVARGHVMRLLMRLTASPLESRERIASMSGMRPRARQSSHEQDAP